MKLLQCRKEAPNDVDKLPGSHSGMSVDHVDVKVNKIDAIVDGAGRGDVLDYRTWC